jgi:hypothetical protein
MKNKNVDFIFDKDFKHKISVDHSIHLLMSTNPNLKSEIDPFHIKKLDRYSRVRTKSDYVRPSKSLIKSIIEQTKSKNYLKFVKGVDYAPFKIIKNRWFLFDIGGKNYSVVFSYNLSQPDQVNVRYLANLYNNKISIQERVSPVFTVKLPFKNEDLFDPSYLTKLIILALFECCKKEDEIPFYKRLNKPLQDAIDVVLKQEKEEEIVCISDVKYIKKIVNIASYEPKHGDIRLNVIGELSIILSLKNDIKID